MKNKFVIFISVMLGFFVMGTVDLAGVATNYIKDDFQLGNLATAVIPMMVFFWFAVISIPTGVLMSRIGQKKTVLIAIALGIVSVVLPCVSYNFYAAITAFSLLGVSNTILQVSLNPLVSGIVAENKLASTLTFGQFIKAVASFLGPIVAGIGVTYFGEWRFVFVVYAAVSVLSLVLLCSIHVEKSNNEPATFGKTAAMLKDGFVFQLFIGILLIVGIDVCMNVYTPQLLKFRLGASTGAAALGSSLYFGARTLGAFLGAFFLIKIKPAKYQFFNMLASVVAFLMLIFASQQWLLLAGIFLVGFSCANVFSIIFTIALQYKPKLTNEISALMIMGVAGGAVVSPIIGAVINISNVSLSFVVLLLCVVYLLLLSRKLLKNV
ncbi:MAG: MFS transporter [Prevotellaceae bacterium]|nr:MFS transporter [Prevotellaceae bacterium]